MPWWNQDLGTRAANNRNKAKSGSKDALRAAGGAARGGDASRDTTAKDDKGRKEIKGWRSSLKSAKSVGNVGSAQEYASKVKSSPYATQDDIKFANDAVRDAQRKAGR